MGTRNLTCVYEGGAYKIAQYGQWDGYLEGAGITVLHFVRDRMDEALFRYALENVTPISAEEVDELEQSYITKEVPMGMLMDDYDNFGRDYPQLHRDMGAKILYYVQDNPDGCKVHLQTSFAADSLFCEWAYVLDMDRRVFEVYEGFNKTPLDEDERFACYEPEPAPRGDIYYPVRKIGEFSFDNLPTDEEFLKQLIPSQEEDAV